MHSVPTELTDDTSNLCIICPRKNSLETKTRDSFAARTSFMRRFQWCADGASPALDARGRAPQMRHLPTAESDPHSAPLCAHLVATCVARTLQCARPRLRWSDVQQHTTLRSGWIAAPSSRVISCSSSSMATSMLHLCTLREDPRHAERRQSDGGSRPSRTPRRGWVRRAACRRHARDGLRHHFVDDSVADWTVTCCRLSFSSYRKNWYGC